MKYQKRISYTLIAILIFSLFPVVTKAAGSTQTTATYAVKKGDTLTKIARTYKMTVTSLKRLNKLKSDVIYIGQKLKVKTSSASSSTSTTSTKAKVKAVGGLNVRSGPSTAYSTKGLLKNGVTVSVISQKSGWVQIKYGSLTGWVSKLYLTLLKTTSPTPSTTPPTSTPTTIVTTGTVKATGGLNVRSGPSTNYGTKGLLKYGVTATVVSQKKGWANIKYGTLTGWVSTTYLTIKTTSTSPKPSTPAPTTPTPTVKTATVKAPSGLNVRSGPSTAYGNKGLLKNGVTVTIVSQQNGWSNIKYGTLTGWVSSSYLITTTSGSATLPPTPTTKKATVKVNGYLNVRSGPAATYGIKGMLQNGTIVDVLSEKNGWSNVKYGTLNGWVSSIYLTDGAITTPAPTSDVLKGKIIVLDPGHGGSDGGATGVDGTNEKTLALSYAQSTKAELENLGATVYMTRTSDTRCGGVWDAETNADLKCRTDFAKANNADIFISVHFNWFYGATGTETYYNETNTYDGTVNPYPQESKRLAQAVHQYYQPAVDLYDRKVQNANYYVNRRAVMPSILLEIGFLSNSNDLARVKNATVRLQTAQAIAKGVTEYFNN